MRGGGVLVLAIAAGAPSSAAPVTHLGAGLSDEASLVQVSEKPEWQLDSRGYSAAHLESTLGRQSEDNFICDFPIKDPMAPKMNLQPNFVACKAHQQQEARKCQGGQCDLVWVGDSIFERLKGMICYLMVPPVLELHKMGETFSETFKYASRTLILAGSGDSTPQTIYMLEHVLPALQSPRAFFVMVGTNNLGVCCGSAEETTHGIKKIIDEIRQRHPRSRVLLHPLLNRAGEGCCNRKMQPLVDEVNVELKAFAHSSDKTVEWVDCGHVFPLGWNETVRSLMPDKLHPSVKGYQAWIRCLNPKLGQALL